MKKQLLLSALLVLTTGCISTEDADTGDASGENTDTTGTGNTNSLKTMVGLLKIEPNSADADFSRALFGQLDPALTAADIESSFAPTVNVCEVGISASDAVDTEYSPSLSINGQESVLVSAGESVIVSSSGGTYATLNQEVADSKPYYKTDVELMGAAPTGLTVDITGDKFPALSNVAINNVLALKLISPSADEVVTAATVFTWEPNNVARSVFELNSGGVGPNNESMQISCTLVDDGSFTFPQALIDIIGAGYVADWASYLRIAYNVVETTDAIMFTANSVRSTD